MLLPCSCTLSVKVFVHVCIDVCMHSVVYIHMMWTSVCVFVCKF